MRSLAKLNDLAGRCNVGLPNPFDLQVILKRTASAKINLGLRVLRKRSDGFHDLETVFLRIRWTDTVTATAADHLSLTCSDPALPTNESNLVMKAARLLAEEKGTAQGARLHLNKHIPYGAGLGGGSSDAAATLLLLNDLWQLNCSPNELHTLAARLGSDVPFFLGADAAYATGRGEILTPLVDPATHQPYLFPFALVVVVPPVAVSTPEAYRLVQPNDHPRPDLRNVVCSNDLDCWNQELGNDFEAPILAQYPAIANAKQLLLDAGAGYACMSGSGSAVFGVFIHEATARQAAETAQDAGLRVWHSIARD